MSVLPLCGCLCDIVWEEYNRDSNREIVWTKGIQQGNAKGSSRARLMISGND